MDTPTLDAPTVLIGSTGRTLWPIRPLAEVPRGEHWVYILTAPLPNVDVEEATACVYIGVTSNLRQRLRSHARKWWWPTIDLTLCEFERFATRPLAEQAEAELIRLERPAMNRAGLVGAL